MILIGISGKKRSGKDTVAGFIADWGRRYCWTVERRAFADPLKEEVIAWLTSEMVRCGFEATEALSKAAFLVHAESEKEKIRPLLQWWGTGLRRELCGKGYWLDVMERWLAKPPLYPATNARRIVVVPDVRFPDEADFIRQRGGLLIRVLRPAASHDNHASETAMDGYYGCDLFLANDGSFDDLKRPVFNFCERELEKR